MTVIDLPLKHGKALNVAGLWYDAPKERADDYYPRIFNERSCYCNLTSFLGITSSDTFLFGNEENPRKGVKSQLVDLRAKIEAIHDDRPDMVVHTYAGHGSNSRDFYSFGLLNEEDEHLLRDVFGDWLPPEASDDYCPVHFIAERYPSIPQFIVVAGCESGFVAEKYGERRNLCITTSTNGESNYDSKLSLHKKLYHSFRLLCAHGSEFGAQDIRGLISEPFSPLDIKKIYYSGAVRSLVPKNIPKSPVEHLQLSVTEGGLNFKPNYTIEERLGILFGNLTDVSHDDQLALLEKLIAVHPLLKSKALAMFGFYACGRPDNFYSKNAKKFLDYFLCNNFLYS